MREQPADFHVAGKWRERVQRLVGQQRAGDPAPAHRDRGMGGGLPVQARRGVPDVGLGPERCDVVEPPGIAVPPRPALLCLRVGARDRVGHGEPVVVCRWPAYRRALLYSSIRVSAWVAVWHEVSANIGTLRLAAVSGARCPPILQPCLVRLTFTIRYWLWRAGRPLAVSIVAVVEGRIGRALLLAVVEDGLGDGRRIDRLTIDHVDIEGEALVVV